MSLERQQRAMRSLGFLGGSSRLARPPQVLAEPDIRPSTGFDPGWTTDFGENFGFGIGLVQVGVDDLHPGAPYALPPGNVGDELFLMMMLAPNVNGTLMAEADIAVGQYDDLTAAYLGPLTIDHYKVHYDSPGNPDGLLVVAHGPRLFPTDHGQIQIIFTGSYPDRPEGVYWSFGNFPAGTYTEIGSKDWWDGTGGSEDDEDDFTAGSLTWHYLMSSSGDSLVHTVAYQSGTSVAGVVSTYWATDDPTITYPAGTTSEIWQQANFYSFKSFGESV